MDDTALRHVLEVSRKMAEIHTITPLLDYVVTEAIALTGAQRGVLVLAELGGSFEFHAGKDSAGKPIENPSDEVSQPRAGAGRATRDVASEGAGPA